MDFAIRNQAGVRNKGRFSRGLRVARRISACWLLFGCNGDCIGSETLLEIPQSRRDTVASVISTGPCGVRRPAGCDAGWACSAFVIYKMSGGGRCQVTVVFNDGSSPFETEVAIDSSSCLQKEPIQVPEH